MTENTSPQTTDALCQCSRWAATVGAGEDRQIHERIYCNQTTKRTFAPGHDAKLKGYLIRWGARYLEVIDRNSGEVWSAQFVANQYGFGHMVSAGIGKELDKAEARRAKADAKHERKAARSAEPTPKVSLVREGRKARSAFRPYQVEVVETPAQPEATAIATIKVGRWTYPATINADGSATYRAKLGGTKVAEAGTFTQV